MSVRSGRQVRLYQAPPHTNWQLVFFVIFVFLCVLCLFPTPPRLPSFNFLILFYYKKNKTCHNNNQPAGFGPCRFHSCDFPFCFCFFFLLLFWRPFSYLHFHFPFLPPHLPSLFRNIAPPQKKMWRRGGGEGREREGGAPGRWGVGASDAHTHSSGVLL